MSQLFASGGQSIGVSASASVLLMNIQDWFPLGLTGWISLMSKGLSTPRTLLQHHSSKASILWRSAFFTVQLSIEVNHLEPCLVHSKYCVYKHQTLCGLYDRIYFLTVLEATNLKSRDKQDGFCWAFTPWLVNSCLLPVSSHDFLCVSIS